jgi:hypothetical protein
MNTTPKIFFMEQLINHYIKDCINIKKIKIVKVIFYFKNTTQERLEPGSRHHIWRGGTLPPGYSWQQS